MNLLHSKPVAHTLHNLNNDYHFRVPQAFQHLGWLGLIVVVASVISLMASASIYGIVGVLAGILLGLPTIVTLLVTRSMLQRRYRVRDGIVYHAALRGDEQILDVGVGSGITLLGCAKHLTTGKGIGIDIYDPNAGGVQPDIFWKNAHHEGVANRVELKQMDARLMIFSDASFDVIVSTFAFHHIGDANARRQAAQEIVRVLKPGGKVLVYDAGFALNELEEVMQKAGIKVQRHGERFSMVIGG